MDIAHPLFSA